MLFMNLCTFIKMTADTSRLHDIHIGYVVIFCYHVSQESLSF